MMLVLIEIDKTILMSTNNIGYEGELKDLECHQALLPGTL